MLPPCFEINRGNELLIDGVRPQDIVAAYGTPVYVLTVRTAAAMLRGLDTWGTSLKAGLSVYFAVKACPLPALLRALSCWGVGAEVSSGFELDLAIKSGIAPEKIIFNGPWKSPEEIDRALDVGIGILNIESEREMSFLAQRGHLGGTRLGIRITPEQDAKNGRERSRFGFTAAAVPAVVAAYRGIEFSGLHCHLGTNLVSAEAYTAAFRSLGTVLQMMAGAPNVSIRYLDVGGGFSPPVSTVRDELERFDMARSDRDYPRVIVRETNQLLLRTGIDGLEELVIEPGRYLVGPAVCLLTAVVDTRSDERGSAVIVDAGQRLMCTNFSDIVHDIVNVHAVRLVGRPIPYDIFGPLCYEGDVLARELPLSSLKRGDILAVFDCGAYDLPLASPFIRELPPVVFADAGSVQEVRRRQRYEDILGCCSHAVR